MCVTTSARQASIGRQDLMRQLFLHMSKQDIKLVSFPRYPSKSAQHSYLPKRGWCLTIHSSRSCFAARLNSGVRPMIRLLLGLLLSPLVLQLPTLWRFTYWHFNYFLLIPAYIAMVLFGVPLVCLFVRKRWVAWWQSILGGVLVSSICLVLWFATSTWEEFLHNWLELTTYGLGWAAVGGIVFWFIALWRNPRFNGPNNSFKPNTLRGSA